ncbi:MAG TPA: sulfite exporter TauE/SafE family protein [Bryobacteraceae bacterium]|nr:sulfite exporter TauE/SafE family protein [Bryobacteraceae bacterium]
MTALDFPHAAVAFGAAFLAGAINSIAGGGTLLSFPTLIWIGLPSVTANATSTVGIWPASASSLWGYRREVRSTEPRMMVLLVPSLIGGIGGALLLRWTPPTTFDALVPFLILFATLLFMAQEPIQRRLKTANAEAHKSAKWLAGAVVFQLLVALYGGYFGAGIGILMLAALSILGLSDIHQMNGLKNFFGGCVNGVAAIYFIWARMVDWPYVIFLALGAMAGGYAGARLARRIGQTAVRRAVVAIGFGMAVSLFVKFLMRG